MYLILFVTFLSTVTSDTCYTDLQFTLTAWKPSSSWVAKGSLDYNVSAGSNTINDGTTTVKQKQFALDVSVDQCSYNCRDGPFVKVSATAKKIPTKTLPGYDYHPGVGYYKYHTSPTHWDNAREICNNEGTHLAVINSEAEAQILGNYIATVPVNGSDFKDYANIGFHDRFVTGLYLTIFVAMSSTVQFILFLTCLSSVTASTCYTDLKFKVSASKTRSSWVAKGSVDYNVSAGSDDATKKQDPFTLDVSVEQCKDNCPNGPFVKVIASAMRNHPKTLPGYDYFEGVGSYKYHTTPTTWDEARMICNNEGTHLAIINSEKEAKIFGNYVTNVPVEGNNYKDYAYIGFHDRFVVMQFLTILDQPLNETGFYRWSSIYEPNNYKGMELCGSVHQNGGLNDIFCTLKQSFICEQELC